MKYGALENWVVLLCRYAGMKCGLKLFRPTRCQNMQNKRRNHLQSNPAPFGRVTFFFLHNELIKTMICFGKVDR